MDPPHHDHRRHRYDPHHHHQDPPRTAPSSRSRYEPYDPHPHASHPQSHPQLIHSSSPLPSQSNSHPPSSYRYPTDITPIYKHYPSQPESPSKHRSTSEISPTLSHLHSYPDQERWLQFRTHSSRNHYSEIDESSSSQRIYKRTRVEQRQRSSSQTRSPVRSYSKGIEIRERHMRLERPNTRQKSQEREGTSRAYVDNREKKRVYTAKKTLQKQNARSRLSVWERIEETPSFLVSPSSNSQAIEKISNESEVREESNFSVKPDKELKLVSPKKNTEVSAKAKVKKKVIVKRKIVKRREKVDRPVVSSSLTIKEEPDKVISPSSKPTVGVRRVKKVVLVKKKKLEKNTGESSACKITSEPDSIVKKEEEGVNLPMVLTGNGESENSEMDSTKKDSNGENIEECKKEDLNMENINEQGISTVNERDCMVSATSIELFIESVARDLVPVSSCLDPVNGIPSNIENETLIEADPEKKSSFDLITGDKQEESKLSEDFISREKNRETENAREKNQGNDKYFAIQSDYFNEVNGENGILPIEADQEMQDDFPIESSTSEDFLLTDESKKESEIIISKKIQEKENDNILHSSRVEDCLTDNLQNSEIGGNEWSGSSPVEYSLNGENGENEIPLRKKENESNTLSGENKESDTSREENEDHQKFDYLETNPLVISTNQTVESSPRSEEDIGNKEKTMIIPDKPKENQRPSYQKPVMSTQIPKFSLNHNARHRTWIRDKQLAKSTGNSQSSSYIRKGNSLIRSASGINPTTTTTITTSINPTIGAMKRVPSYEKKVDFIDNGCNPNPNTNSSIERPTTPPLVATDNLEGTTCNVPKLCEEEQNGLKKSENVDANKMVYVKKSKNQLVLNNNSAPTFDGQSKKDLNLGENSNSDDNRDSDLLQKRLDKGLQQMNTVTTAPNVWTLSGQQSKTNGTTTTKMNHLRAIPYLLPWRRNLILNKIKRSSSNNKSSYWLLRKLLMTRKRDTVYKVSSDGFSLRKSRVLSIGGSSLKWSRSIEISAKKANEEATLAVAEVERKKREKREKRKSASLRSKGKKVDQAGNKPLICSGYVRVSKGNQLVRDPRRLVRILASEKIIQKSLHKARTRFARKKQYCLFFTRFGWCNKSGGNCKFIHDPAKIAICTKFLRGLCINPKCKLTHKIIPERMPECSYFLQGLCTNLNCPYRHVNVNPNAPICEGFLRGYCADGDECHKKHSYVCPIFETKGECLQGPKCKLYHPRRTKNKNKKSSSKKRKNFLNNKRYFESSIDAGMPVNLDKCGGHFGDFICLDLDGEETGTDIDVPRDLKMMDLLDSDCSDLEVDDKLDDDELIKPVRIMGRAAGLAIS